MGNYSFDFVDEDGGYTCYEVPAASLARSLELFGHMQEGEVEALYRLNGPMEYNPLSPSK